jgi:CheY-like chemotaxis protein
MEIRKKTILAIDDNSDNLVTLKALINELFPDFDFIKADNGTSGIALAEKSEPDIILLDIICRDLMGMKYVKA